MADFPRLDSPKQWLWRCRGAAAAAAAAAEAHARPAGQVGRRAVALRVSSVPRAWGRRGRRRRGRGCDAAAAERPFLLGGCDETAAAAPLQSRKSAAASRRPSAALFAVSCLCSLITRQFEAENGCFFPSFRSLHGQPTATESPT